MLLLALAADARRPRKDRRTAKMLFEEIRKNGYVGGYTIVCDFVRNWRNQGGQSKTAYVPLKFALGEVLCSFGSRAIQETCNGCR